MLELIFKGFVEWGYGLALECWEYFSDILMDVLNMDFGYLRTHVPVVDTIMQIMLAVGWALLLGNLVFQALKSMVTGLGFEAEDPKLLFARTFVFAFLLLASPQICEIGLNMTQTIITVLQIPDAVQITFADESTFGGIAAAWILVVILGIVVMFKVFRLILEIAERYVILGMLTICAPLAFGVGGSRNTSDIFTGWCRMFASMCFVMVSNVIFFKMLLSVLSYVPSGLDVLPWMVLVLTITKVARKVDAIITRIGLNPAITGDSLGGRGLPGMLTYTILRAATKQVVQTAGKNGGGTHGAGPQTPPGGGSGGGPKTGAPPGGGHFGKGAKHTGGAAGSANASYQSTSSQQNSAAHPSGQNGSAVFNTSTQSASAQQEKAQATHQAAQPTAGSSSLGANRPGAAGQNRANSSFGGSQTRQSSVPPGTRRSVSHVKQHPSGTAGTPAPHETKQSDQRPGTFSGTAGMGAPGPGTRPGKVAQSSGLGGIAAAQSRFTQSVQQSSRGGDLSSAQHSSQQQNISVAAASTNRNGGASATQTRRPTPAGTAQRASVGGTAGTGAAHPPPQAASAHAATSRSVFSVSPGTPAPPVRHGRNTAAPSPSAPLPKAETTSRTARQERPAVMGGTPPRTPGMAGIRGVRPQQRPTAQSAERASSRPPADVPGAKPMPSETTARQENAKTEPQQSSRGERGGDEHG